MKKMPSTFLVFLLVLLPFTLQAKSSRIRFGKLEPQELLTTECPIDSAAKAYYIVDRGSSEIILIRGFELLRKRHLRIKILDKEALKYAHFEFEFFKEGDEIEYSLDGLKAQTYNLLDGEVIVSELDEDSIITDNDDKHCQVVSFTMPNVKVGSVIELTYTLKTKQLDRIKSWQFQYDIPVMKSEFSITVPEYFGFRLYPYGDVPLKLEQYSSVGKFLFIRNAEFVHASEVIHYEADSVPALLPLSPRPVSDLAARIDFELREVTLSDRLRDLIAENDSYALNGLKIRTWKDVNTSLFNSPEFGKRLKDTVGIDVLKSTRKTASDTLANIQHAFRAIKGATVWNGEKSCYATKSISKTIEEGGGSVTEINLALVALLRQIGCKAYPVVLSTVDNGYIRPYMISASVFNYTIAACKYKGKMLLMDATDDLSSINDLPKRCHNGDGFLVDKDESRWVTIKEVIPEDE